MFTSFTPTINIPVKSMVSFPNEDLTNTSNTWDLTSFIGVLSHVPAPLITGLLVASFACIIWGMILLLKKILSVDHDLTSWGQVIMPHIAGGMLLTLSVIAQSAKKKATTDETVTPPTVTPSPPSPETPSDPIVLPEIQNLGSLWIIPVVLITLAILYLFIRKISHDRSASNEAKVERAKQLALQQKIAENIARRWDAVVANHQRLKKLYLEAETDWDMLFSYPALQDVSVPETSALIHALMTANDSDPAQPDSLTEVSDLSDYSYVRAVNNLSTAWKRALENAQHIGQSGIPREERKTIKQIRNLLNLAENSGATPSERELAYSRAQLLMKTLSSVTVPPALMLAIDTGQRLAIEAAPVSTVKENSSAIAL